MPKSFSTELWVVGDLVGVKRINDTRLSKDTGMERQRERRTAIAVEELMHLRHERLLVATRTFSEDGCDRHGVRGGLIASTDIPG